MRFTPPRIENPNAFLCGYIVRDLRYQMIYKCFVLFLGGGAYVTVNYTELRGHMKEYMDKVTDDFETLIVTRKKNKNIVMISEETYNNMIENMHLMGNETNYKWLMESKKQLETTWFR